MRKFGFYKDFVYLPEFTIVARNRARAIKKAFEYYGDDVSWLIVKELAN